MNRRTLAVLVVGLAAGLAVGVVLSVRSQDAAAPAAPAAPPGTVFPRTPSPAGAMSYIISPADGETVEGTFTVRFGLKGMGIAPAGIPFEDTGHHHILIDVSDEEMPKMTEPLPTTEKVVHFGKGQTETELTLPSGRHTLQLILGDASHIPHDPPLVSKRITVNVR